MNPFGGLFILHAIRSNVVYNSINLKIIHSFMQPYKRTFQSKFLTSAQRYNIFVTVSDAEKYELGHEKFNNRNVRRAYTEISQRIKRRVCSWPPLSII